MHQGIWPAIQAIAAEYPVTPGILRLFVCTVVEVRKAAAFKLVFVKGHA